MKICHNKNIKVSAFQGSNSISLRCYEYSNFLKNTFRKSWDNIIIYSTKWIISEAVAFVFAWQEEMVLVFVAPNNDQGACIYTLQPLYLLIFWLHFIFYISHFIHSSKFHNWSDVRPNVDMALFPPLQHLIFFFSESSQIL